MKHIKKLIFGIAVATCTLSLAISAHSAVLISDFGASIEPEDLAGSWVGNYDPTTSTVAATDAAGGISDFTGPPISDFGAFNLLRLTASVSTNPNSSFRITLEDNNGLGAFGDFSWSSFSTSLTPVTTSLSIPTGFDSGNVIGWTLETGGVIPNSLTVQFNSLTVIPEPQAWLLIVGALVLMTIFRKRSKAVA